MDTRFPAWDEVLKKCGYLSGFCADQSELLLRIAGCKAEKEE